MDTSLKSINDENILDNIFNEAMDLIEKGNIEQGLEKLRNLSRQKYGKAQYKLGYYYLNGEYVKKDYPELIVKPFRHNITREMAVIYSRERYLSCAVKEAVRFTLDYFSNAENELVRRKPD